MSKRKNSTFRKKEALAGYLFISPWLIGLLAFIIGPFIASFFLSFYRYDILTPAKWVGIRNFQKMFTRDIFFWQSMKVTLTYTLVGVPLRIIFALLVAMLMNQAVRGIKVYRTIFYLPSVISGVAIAVTWMWMFASRNGLLNNLLAIFGISGPAWLLDEKSALAALILMSLWTTGVQMVIFLASLQQIPTRLYEAAKIDGANIFQKFIKITLPLITPAIFFNMTIDLIWRFQEFTSPYMMTNGGPNNATLLNALLLYRNAFDSLRMGYASAMGWFFFGTTLIVTLVFFKLSKLWVFYEAK